MKLVFTSLLVLFFALESSGQSTSGAAADTVNICGHVLKIPSELKLTKPKELTGDHYSVSWTYITQKQLEKMPEKMASSLNKKLKNVSSLSLDCSFFFQSAKAYGFTYDNENGSREGQMIIFATVNNQPVYMQIKLSTTVFENEKLPLFINRILVLAQ